MRNSSRNLHVTLFSCLVKLFYFSVLLLLFFATFMVNKDKYKSGRLGLYGHEHLKCGRMMTLGFNGLKW